MTSHQAATRSGWLIKLSSIKRRVSSEASPENSNHNIAHRSRTRINTAKVSRTRKEISKTLETIPEATEAEEEEEGNNYPTLGTSKPSNLMITASPDPGSISEDNGHNNSDASEVIINLV